MRFSSTAAALFSVSGLALAAPLRRSAKRANDALDAAVFQFAHALELLEANFYLQGLNAFTASDFLTAGFAIPELVIEQLVFIGTDEAEHVSILEEAIGALGETPLSTCVFDFSSVLTDVTTMIQTARALEYVGTSAYLGALTILDDPELLLAAATITTIEARHSSVLNIFNGGSALPQAFDIPLSPNEVATIALQFISGCNIGFSGNLPLVAETQGPLMAGMPMSWSWGTTGNMMSSSSPGAENLQCQFLVGGLPDAITMPLSQCTVPPNVNGPVYAFITNSTQPLLNDIVVQFAGEIVAGPAIVFIDTVQEIIDEVVITGGASGSSSSIISPAQASGIIQGCMAAGNCTISGSPMDGSLSYNGTSVSDGAVSPPESSNSSYPAGATPPGTTAYDGQATVLAYDTIPVSTLP